MRPQREGASEAPADNPSGRPLPTGHIRWLDVCRLGHASARSVPQAPSRWLSSFALAGFLALIALLGFLTSPALAQTLSDDASLSALTLSQGRLDPAFASATTEYRASVGYTVTRITVTLSLGDSDASFAFLDASDSVLPDRDTVAAGHQIDLVVGENVFKVRVTAEDNLATRTYVVSVTRTEADTSLSPSASDPPSTFASNAVYRVTFTGAWTSLATPDGLPSGAHFSPLIGAVHNANVTFVEGDRTASAGVESMAELGGTAGLEAEVTAAVDALSVLRGSGNISPSSAQSLTTTLTDEHPRVTLLTMVAPSPDWFVGVSGLLLINSEGRWLRSHDVALYPWDAGTEDGGEFSLSNDATVPPGVITSIRGTGKFSTEPIASLSFTLESVITTRSVAENTEAGVNIGEPVVATDSSGAVTYSLGGTDAASFEIVAATGQLQTKAALDYETRTSYEVTVTGTDTDGSVSTTVAIGVSNVIELTTFSGPTLVTFAENGATRVATFSYSSDEDRDGIEWVMAGVDRGLFSLDSPSGALRFLQAPDFENPLDVGPPGRATNNSYELKLVAWARDNDQIFTDEVDVEVMVTDVDEAGALSLSSTRPALGAVLTAVLTDPDGVMDGTTSWRWERSAGRNAWALIDDAAAASYTPAAADTNTFLRVTATYADEHGTGKTVSEVAPNVVTGPLLTSLTAETDDSQAAPARGLYPAFDPLTLHYGIGCNGADTLVLTVSAATNARVAVDAVQAASAPMAVDVSEDSDVAIRVTDASGAGTTYVVHCLPEVFFEIETHTFPNTDAFEDLILFNREDYLRLMDRNGVPRLHLDLGSGSGTFAVRFHRVGADGAYRYGFWAGSDSYTILDEDFEVVDDDVSTVAPLTRHNSHDFQILEDGSYLVMAYERATRDFSDIDLPYFDGADVSSVGVNDAAVQIVTPGRRAVFTWNSWGNMAIEDCVQHRFPVTLSTDPDMRSPNGGYAHINGMHMVDDVLVASMRGCSKVLGIDVGPGATRGDVLWRMGRTNLSDAEWAARDIGPRPLDFINDPAGEFCGQHTARFLPNGNVFLFDNGVVCLIDPWTFDASGRAGNDFSRAVEYALDLENHEAVFVRDHSLRGERSHLGYANGNVDVLDNGDWLVSWGRPLDVDVTIPDNERVTLVDPATGQEKLGIRFRELPSDERQRRINATVAPAEVLAPQPVPLTAEFPASAHTSVFNLGVTDPPQVVVAFSRPVVDFDENTPSLSVTGATVASVSAHVVAGEPAHAYLVTLTPDGDGAISFRLVTGQACGADGGICAADGTALSEAPSELVIGAPVTVSFAQTEYSVSEGGMASVQVRLSSAHQGVRGVTVPVVLRTTGSASADDLTLDESVTFEAGERSKPLAFNANDDDLVEGAETATLEFGTLPDGVTEGATATTTVTLADADPAQIDFTVATSEVAEGGETTFSFAFVNAVSFEREQTINLSVGGTATEGNDFTIVDAQGQTLSSPYALTFMAGTSSVEATLSAVDDTEIEAMAETVTLSATLATTNRSLGVQTITIPASDVPDTPVVTIAAGSTVPEGADAIFTLSRTDAQNHPLTNPLTVSVSVTETGSTLSGSTPGSVTFAANSSTAGLTVATLNDTVIEQAGAINVLVLGDQSVPPIYLTGADNSASVRANDDDVAAFTVSVSAEEVAEGGSATLTVETLSVTFAEPQTLTLMFAGTATAELDYTVADRNGRDLATPYGFTLPASWSAATVTVRVETDSEEDAGETIEISVSHDGNVVGAVTVTVTETAGPTITTTVTTGGGGGGGAPPVPIPSDADFDWNVTRDIESLDRDNDLPTGIWSDGETLWVLENASTGADAIFAYDLETGDRLANQEFELDRRNRFSHGIWSDGKTIWIADSGQDRLFAYDLKSGERLEERDIELAERNRDPRGIWSDGETIYVLDSVKDALFVYDFETGELLAEHPLDKLNKSPRGTWSDGVTIWVSDDGAKRLFAYRVEDETLKRHEDEEFTFRSLLKAGNGDARGIWSDGDVVYVADEQDDKVYSYNIPDAIIARLASLSLSGVEIDEFSPGRLTYNAMAETAATVTTIEAIATQEAATVVITPTDSDGDADNGHQVALEAETEITITLTSSDGSRTRSYRVLVEKPLCLTGLTAERLSKVTFVGGSVEDLDRCASEQGVAAFFYWTGDSWLLYAPDAPEFLSHQFNQHFSDGVPAGAPLIAVGNGQHRTDN